MTSHNLNLDVSIFLYGYSFLKMIPKGLIHFATIFAVPSCEILNDLIVW